MVAAALSTGAIAAAPKPKPAPPAPKPTNADFAVVKPEWFNRRPVCSVSYAEANHFKACLRVYVSRLPRIDHAKREHFGEKYDPDRYYECRAAQQPNVLSVCTQYELRRVESPEHWPFHQSSPMKWPDAPATPVYREGMSPVAYWRALCKAEAGEFIHRKVEKVDGLFLIRPRTPEMEGAGGDRYVMEDPYGYVRGESGSLSGVPGMWLGPVATSVKTGPRFRYLETLPLADDYAAGRRKYRDPSLFQSKPPGMPYQRFTREGGELNATKLEYVRKVSARYGVTWRGIDRPKARELGIAGGELAVVDLRSGELLGLRRGFSLGTFNLGNARGLGWDAGVCPEYASMPGVGQIRGRNKDSDFSTWFITKVLVPEYVISD